MRTSALVDRFGRVHDSLRVSVTDRCNIRCFYCMPEHANDFFPSQRLLSLDEIARVVRVMTELGIRKIRLTGGEPLLRSGLDELVRDLSGIGAIDDIALTTNGILLPKVAAALKVAGLKRLNISLDTLREATFQKISRRQGIDQVIDGIDHAIDVGFDSIRLNALSIRGLTENEVLPLVEFARRRNLTLRFIEYMPLDADRAWQDEDVLRGADVRRQIESAFGELTCVGRDEPAQPAVDYTFADRSGKIGFINPISEPFCGACNRLRLTADGAIRNCLFSDDQWNLRDQLRGGADNSEIKQTIRNCVTAKQPGHLISRPGFKAPEQAMYQIGG